MGYSVIDGQFMVILIIWPAKKIPISIAINSINYPIKPIKAQFKLANHNGIIP